MQNPPVDAPPQVLERIMSLRINKALWRPNSKPAAVRLERYDSAIAPRWIVHAIRREKAFLETFFKRFDHHDAKMSGRKAGLHNPRVVKCHSQLAAAVDALAALLPANIFPKEVAAKAIQLIDDMALERQTSAAADHPTVQRFCEIVDYLLSREQQGSWEDGSSLQQHRKPEQFFAINLTNFEQRARNANLCPPGPGELKRHLKGSRSRKFVDAKPVNNPAGKHTHCSIFERSGARAAPSPTLDPALS